MNRLPTILFVCIENSCRSQMAEGFARRHGATYVRVRTDERLEGAVRRFVGRSVD